MYFYKVKHYKTSLWLISDKMPKMTRNVVDKAEFVQVSYKRYMADKEKSSFVSDVKLLTTLLTGRRQRISC